MQTYTISLVQHYPLLGEKGADPKLTVYLQEDITEGDCKGMFRPSPRPALIILPGGGYHHVGRREGEPIALAFMSLGFNCFVLDYSVAPYTYPQQLRETAAAADLICRNAKSWNIDTEKLVMIGFSAGGHLAASYCTIRNRPEITEFIEPKPLCAAILGYAVTTAHVENYHGDTYKNLLGTDTPTPEQLDSQCLDSFVTRECTPPTFLWHTAEDRSVPVASTMRYGEALAKAGIPFEVHVFPAGRHGMGTADCQGVHDYDAPENRYASQWVNLAKGWLKQFILKN